MYKATHQRVIGDDIYNAIPFYNTYSIIILQNKQLEANVNQLIKMYEDVQLNEKYIIYIDKMNEYLNYHCRFWHLTLLLQHWKE